MLNNDSASLHNVWMSRSVSEPADWAAVVVVIVVVVVVGFVAALVLDDDDTVWPKVLGWVEDIVVGIIWYWGSI